MSVKATVFKAIGDRLMQEVPALQWYDKDFGQAQMIQDGIITLPMPAVLITINVPQWDTIIGGTQNGQAAIRIRMLYENYADSFQTPEADSINQDKALEFFDFEEAVHLALQNFSGNGFTPLNRMADTEDDDHNNVIVTDMMYECVITQQSPTNNTVVKENVYPVPQYKDELAKPTNNDFIIG